MRSLTKFLLKIWYFQPTNIFPDMMHQFGETYKVWGKAKEMLTRKEEKVWGKGSKKNGIEGLTTTLIQRKIKEKENKLGLNQAKLCSNLNWTLLQSRVTASKVRMPTINHDILLSMSSLCPEHILSFPLTLKDKTQLIDWLFYWGEGV